LSGELVLIVLFNNKQKTNKLINQFWHISKIIIFAPAL